MQVSTELWQVHACDRKRDGRSDGLPEAEQDAGAKGPKRE